MKSRLLGLTMGALAALGAFCADGWAQVTELKLSHYLPPNHTIHKELTRWADEIARKSDGRLKLTVFPAGQMGPVGRQIDLARTGVADMAFVLHGAVPGRFPLTQVAQLPYMFHRPLTGGGTEAVSAADASAILTRLAPELAAEHSGTHILYLIATPAVHLFFNKAVVREPADLAGLRIRHNGTIAADIAKEWNAIPAAIAPPELGDAIQKGTIDGLFFAHEAAKAFQLGGDLHTVTELSLQAGTFALVMNEVAYRALPADLRRVVDETTGPEAARRIGGEYDKAEAEGRDYMRQSGIRVTELTTAQREAFRKAAQPVTDQGIADREAKGVKAKAFRDHLTALVTEVGR